MTTNTLLDLRIKVSPALNKKFLELQKKLGLEKGELVKLAISKLAETEETKLSDNDLKKLILALVKSQKSKPVVKVDEINKMVKSVRNGSK